MGMGCRAKTATLIMVVNQANRPNFREHSQITWLGCPAQEVARIFSVEFSYDLFGNWRFSRLHDFACLDFYLLDG